MKNSTKIKIVLVSLVVSLLAIFAIANPASQKPRGYDVGSVSTVIIPAMRPLTKVVWAISNAYTQGQYLKVPTNNNDVYWCLSAGTSGATEPVWNKTNDITDGSVTWSTVDIQRGKLYIQNWGTNSTVFLGFDWPAVENQGGGMSVSGGSFSIDLNAYQGEIRANSGAGNTNRVTTQILP